MSSENMHTEPISTPIGSTHFKFLDLPRELRDIIYEYTLWEPDGLFYYRNTAYTATFSASKDNPHEETNQLQHICRQIQQETKGLEFKVNDLIFLHDALDPIRTSAYLEQTPAMQLLGYLDMSLESQQRLLRTVRLRDTSLELERLNDRSYMQDLHSVAHWCQRHPETLVFWEFPLNRGRGQEYPESLLLDGLMFATAYRLSFPVDKWLSRLNLNTLWCNATIYRSMWQAGNKCCSYRPHCWGRSKNCVKVADAENFRIVPEDGPLREKEFREAVVKGRSGDVSQDYVDGCLELARIFYYDGI